MVIYGGTVSATGGEDGAGIGGGYVHDGLLSSNYGGHGCQLTIYGGEVTAQGGDDASGIGGGGNYPNFNGSNYFGTTIIHGGTVTDTGGENGAGIGGGKEGEDTHDNYLEILGGTVTAQGGENGAGIGGGEGGAMFIVRISGGTTVATGGDSRPGIGGTEKPSGLCNPSLTISGDAKVTAIGSGGGAGIGGGRFSTNPNWGGYFPVTITGGEVIARGDGDGAGIGSCSSSSQMGDLTITGGVVTATGGGSSVWGAIGGVPNGTPTITLGDMRVSGGSSESSLALVAASERLSAINGHTNTCVRIEPCTPHEFTDNTHIHSGTQHNITCHYCANVDNFDHDFTDGGTCACGLATLADNESNDAHLAAWNGETKTVVLSGRTLSASSYNTLCLPFDISDISTTPLAGATVAPVNASLNGTTLSLMLGTKTSAITAGVPYVVKPTADVANPVFTDVIIKNELNPYGSTDGSVRFEGNFSPFEIVEGGAEGTNQGNIDEIVYLGTNNVVGYASAPRTLRAFRAHFVLPLTPSGARAMTHGIVDFGDGTTAVAPAHLQPAIGSVRAGWYTIDGRQLPSEPLQKGLYIRDGKKVVIR